MARPWVGNPDVRMDAAGDSRRVQGALQTQDRECRYPHRLLLALDLRQGHLLRAARVTAGAQELDEGTMRPAERSKQTLPCASRSSLASCQPPDVAASTDELEEALLRSGPAGPHE